MDISLPLVGPVVGIGVDITDVSRIGEILDRQGKRFIERVFTEEEYEYCLSHKYSNKHFAARFAAKEAVAKAFSTGIGEYLNWTSVSVSRGDRGQPIVFLDEKGSALLKMVGGKGVSISLSHTDETAIAFAAIIGKG
ncbi:holo-ACP synthase [Puniceicoccaceae bacterium K14]|nr:holo-ACP synthase [Puniceicoccaceae bacterium K14]